jgi:uncharacterized membrane protein
MLYAKEILIVALSTLIPALELRASIPLGVGLGVPWILVFFVAVLVNIILGPIVYILLDKFVCLLKKDSIFERIYSKFVLRTQKKVSKYVEKYGEWAIAAFIAVPIPGSGSYSGALAAYLIGLSYKKFVISNLIGVLIAGIIVTVVTLFFKSVF